MSRILQIAAGHQVLKAVFTGNSPLPILLWALVEEGDQTKLIGIVLDPETKRIVRADELEGFRGYTD
jgi:hypothetical protein